MPWLVAIVIGGVAFGIYKLVKLNAESDKIIPEIKGRIHKIDWTGITLAIDVSLKNAGSLRLALTTPFITVIYKGSAIISSNVDDTIIQIEPLQTSRLPTILLKINYLTILGAAGELIKKIQSKTSKIEAEVLILSYVLLNQDNPKEHLSDYSKNNKPTIHEYKKTIPVSF
jgi:hypothetical protein